MGLKTFLRKGDEVVVLSGKGTVIVEGVNLVKKHARPTKDNPQGGVIDKAMPLPNAKVMLVCTGCGQPARIKRDRLPNGSVARICKKCGHNFD